MTMTAEQRAQLREEFEQWAEQVGALPWGILRKHRKQDGSYPRPHYTYMWEAYQAAHTSLLDELERKDKRIAELKFVCESAYQVQRECAEALGCAGDNESILVAIDEIKSRIAELEAREIALPKPLKVLLSRSGESINAWPAYTVDSAIRAAGINLTVEG